MSDVTQSLSIKRQKLIDRLKEVRSEHAAKRAEAQAQLEADRAKLLNAVETLTTDQVANILAHHVTGDQDKLVKTIREWVEKERYVSLPIEPTGVETTLDRQIRVFELADNATIELKPSDSVYSYL